MQEICVDGLKISRSVGIVSLLYGADENLLVLSLRRR